MHADPAAAGRRPAPHRRCRAIASGPDQGQHLLPVQNTTTPVGLDQLADITRLPEQQRLQLVISGLGAGLAGNGQELNAALLRADPALAADRPVIAVLATQNRVLARLTDESDRILAPLAAQRGHVGGVHRARARRSRWRGTAAEGPAIQQNLARFPPFLRQLRPAAQRLTELAASDDSGARSRSHAQAPAINASLQGLGPLATTRSRRSRRSGNVAAARRDACSRGSTRWCASCSRSPTPLQPLASDLAALSSSFDNAGGIEDVMRFIYYYTGAVNGEDALGHYIRSSFEVGACSARSSSQVGRLRIDVRHDDGRQRGAARAISGPDRRRQAPLTTARPRRQRRCLDYLLEP